MAFVNEPKKLYTHAVKNNYIMPACHMGTDMASLKAILDAAEEEDSPVVVQAAEYLDANFSPLPAFFEYFKALCSRYKTPILLNHDHIPKVENCLKAIDNGYPSVMYDGSHLPFEENVKNTKKIAEYAHEHGAWVEAELGNIPGFEDMVIATQNTVYTDPGKAAEFIERTECDSLAVAVGTAHGGVKAGKPLEIDFDLLGRIRKAVGPEFPLVLHGAASLPRNLIDEVNRYGGKAEYLDMCPEETIEKTRLYGVAKANMDVDNWLVVTGVVRKFFVEKPDVYNQAIYMGTAMGAMKEFIRHKMRDVTKSSGNGSEFYKD